jgi:soluble lytic murein transglycosylase
MNMASLALLTLHPFLTQRIPLNPTGTQVFMRRFFLYSCSLLALASPLMTAAMPMPAYALSQEQSEHARSAFMFIDRKGWTNAMLHAQRTGDASLLALAQWYYLQDPDSGATFHEINEFLRNHPQWPDQKKLRTRAEMVLMEAHLPAQEVVEWFASTGPITGVGKFVLARALSSQATQPAEMIRSLMREAWREGDFTQMQEQQFLQEHASALRPEDERARGDRLAWEGKTSQLERLYARLGDDVQKLYKARLALQADAKDAPQLVSQVPASLRNDVGLLFDRLRYRAKKDDISGVRELLLAAPKEVPYPQRWWKMRERQIREAIDERDYALAGKLLANHGQVEGQGAAEALWLKGWLLLEFKNKPKEAYPIFYRMFETVKFPVSKARAAYWAGRAASRAGDGEGAASWFNTASAYPTSFYGQLAAYEYFGKAPLHLPATPTISAQTRSQFESSEVVRAIRLSLQFDALETAERLMNSLIENATDDDIPAMVAEQGSSASRPHLSVRAAKKALQQGVVLVGAGYPRPKTPEGIAVPRELALAITRQESEFNRTAKSSAGALGMMQLLPSTAKETATKQGLGFSPDRLLEPDYNTILGSHYLSRMIDNYDGSYIMAIASYNAGPGNVRKWVQRFGTPGDKLTDAVNWIEKIPFSETRNYVMRVIENLQIYRHLEQESGQTPQLLIGQDLVR